MKNITFVIVAVVVALLIGFGFTHFYKHKAAPVTPAVSNTTSSTGGTIDLSPDADAAQTCYIWNTEAGDKAMISMDIRGNNVIGEFYWLPAEKDRKTGVFKGTVTPADPKTMSRTANTIWESFGEGLKTNEELRIIFGKGIASPGFGVMKDRGDGTYVYADPKNISYDLNLSQTDCGDEAMD